MKPSCAQPAALILLVTIQTAMGFVSMVPGVSFSTDKLPMLRSPSVSRLLPGGRLQTGRSCSLRADRYGLRMSGAPSGGQDVSPSAEGGNFFKRIIKERSLSTVGCLAGIVAGAYISYQLIKLILWGVSKVLSFLLVNLCTLYPFPFCYWVVPKWISSVISGIVVLLTVGPIVAYAPSMISSAAVPNFVLEQEVTGNGLTLQVRKYDALTVAEMPAVRN
eukprot:652589-Hanusia_phi.AAC.1